MNLLVGKNSIIYNYILSKYNYNFNCVAVSTNEIFNIDLNLYNKIYIFSYKTNNYENEKLFKYISDYKKISIVLISSVSVLVTQKTFFYAYPKIKFFQEYFLMKHCKRYNIIRLGRFDYGKRVNSPDLISTVDMLLSAMMQPVNNDIINAFVVNDHKLSNFNRYYLYLLKYNSIRPLTRLIDLILKIFNYKFYGYTALTYYLYV